MVPHPCLSPWKGAVAGGLIAFGWSALSWTVLPFHEMTLRSFPLYAALGAEPTAPALLAGLLCQGAGAFFWTWILGKIPGLTMKDAALYGFFFGLCLGFLGFLPNSVWWKWPLPFSLMYVVDACVAWTLASVVIARWCQASVCALPAR